LKEERFPTKAVTDTWVKKGRRPEKETALLPVSYYCGLRTDSPLRFCRCRECEITKMGFTRLQQEQVGVEGPRILEKYATKNMDNTHL
jgi:hypothetical protein